MTLTRKEYQVIIATILKYGLPQAGLSSTIHRVARYRPSSLVGIILIDLFLQQGAGYIVFLIEHSWDKTPSRTLLIPNILSLKVEAGFDGHII